MDSQVLDRSETAAKDMVLVCGADDRFAMPMTMMLFSALSSMHPSHVLRIFVLDDGITPRSKDRSLRCLTRTGKRFSLEWVRPDTSMIRSLMVTPHISRATYLRLLIPRLLPAEIDRAIYLDCDMIVRRDIAELWSKKFDGRPLLAVRDFHFSTVSHHDALPDWKELGHRSDDAYFNAGLLVLDLDAWRKEDVSAQVLHYLARRSDRGAHDQAGLNAVLAGRWTQLDPRWNVTLSSISTFDVKYFGLSSEEVRSDPWVIHYTSWFKPWMIATRNRSALAAAYFDQPLRDPFFRVLQASGWYGPLTSMGWVALRRAALAVLYKAPRRLPNAIPGWRDRPTREGRLTGADDGNERGKTDASLSA